MPHPAKRIVYLLESLMTPNQRYIGLTSNLDTRLQAHNQGHSPHTRKHRPWRLLVAIEFSDPDSALHFEQYLKSGSGRAFAKRHFV